MPLDTLLALAVFTFVTAFTPGPNNIMVTASGVNFGFARTVPHMAGITAGFAVLLIACAAGLGLLFTTVPVLQLALKVVGVLYMLWLAWKLATSRTAPGEVAASARPLGFWGAAAFQWVNPKAWVMCMTAMTAYLPVDASVLQVVLLGSLFMVLGIPCVGAWAAFGSSMRRFLQDPLKLRIFNNAMALALVASLYPMLIP